MRVSSVPSIGILLILSACGYVVEVHDRGEVCINDDEIQVNLMEAICVSPSCDVWLDARCSATIEGDVLVISTYAQARKRDKPNGCDDSCVGKTVECDLPDGDYSRVELGGQPVDRLCDE